MSYLRSLNANCIRCGNFCDDSLFCDLCDKNSRHSVAELCKRYNTKLNKISQFVFDLFVELYKCGYFVNSFHRRNRKMEEKNKSNSLQTDFTALRNSQYKVMRHFASQMSLQNPIDDDSSGGEEDCSSEMDAQSEDEFLCVNLAAPNRHSYGSYLSQTSSNFSTQLKTQSVKTCSEQQNEANGVDHNYEYIDITAQQEPDSRFSSLSRQEATNSESEEHEQSSASEDRDTILSRYHSADVEGVDQRQPRVQPRAAAEGRGWGSSCGEHNQITFPLSDQTHHTYEVLDASPTTPNIESVGNSGIGGVILDLQEIDDMFNFDQTGPLSTSVLDGEDKSDSLENDKSQFEETTKLEREVAVSTPLVTRAMRGNTHSLLLTETGDEKVQVSEPMTPQPHRRAAQNRTTPADGGHSAAPVQSQFQLYSRQYANNFAPPSRPLASIRKQSTGDSSSGLFQSLARLWAKKKDSSEQSQNSESSDGLLEPEFLVENTIKLYFKCMHKLHGGSLKGVECTDLRLELINKLKDLRIILEGPQADDMEEISFAINKLIILINRLFQKALSKHEMNLIRIISQYLTKKCLESAFRMRNFRERKTELFQKLIKVLDREL
ncbi:uncharacterized protein LOC142340849 [Convolutriloba macropyga]|uniref:uncharacterized protein LOC142340849 n=1 Tax=Convolutriloba macropyga TaxID=536237 RepID=UPI003F51D886